MPTPNVKEICRVNDTLTSQNQNWRNYWQDVADFCLPRKAWATTFRQKGDRLDFNFLYDSEAIRALKIMVAGFYSHLTNPATNWFGMQARRLDVRRNRAVQLWFKDVEEIMYPSLSNTNFYSVAKEFYADAGCFGTGIFYSEKDERTKVRYKSIPVHECNIVDDASGRLSEVYWNFKLTPDQAKKVWGAAVGEAVLKNYENVDKRYEEMEFLMYVGPREDREYGKLDKLNMPYQSCWISKADKHLIAESGFEEMPFFAGRWWKDPNDAYGYSPAMDVLADIKLRNAQKKTALRRAMKETDPPLDLPSRGYVLPLNLNPAAMNYRDPKLAADNGLRAIGVGKGDFAISKEMMEDVRQAIRDGFFVPLFMGLSQTTKQMTVPEVQERIREGMILLGPAVGNFTEEAFDPAIIRHFNILYRMGEIPEPPQELQGEEFDIVYRSPLVRAQRESEIQGIQLFLSDVGVIAQAKPGVLDKIDEDKTIDIIAKIREVNPEIIRSERDVIEIRRRRDELAAKQAEMDAAHKAAAIAKTGADANKSMAQAAA